MLFEASCLKSTKSHLQIEKSSAYLRWKFGGLVNVSYVWGDGSFPGISANFKIMCCGTEPFFRVFYVPGGPGSSVGIATGYGLDGPGIE